ncbi:sulfite dehydrogenase [Bradyrhizobium sp. U87765 SZCCT0131]|uniref:sulfite dehydrogenase n=1 Tax=unclassified Bradyrhizobium TaxID=2631580 RepID=UPI001BA9C73C|nr:MULTISPECIES: sulfite dehydrogenase [unclassified Bradyrhizobium]MBR1219209.1 sulfite dehydrogenase [Bradyrhizobium sp. U87765 SZCCT0131]MBR1261860.1 sulfite dehydrogenase [Bradyrhizobium sp. U87765 SZCCT0134]MBR1306287.1 sulfite dehydrogenase [Bradyrhizobium sp. U87765 SZCCT0110]MBR1317642.1 sulfite dehydrogenase [Bradyrhizobium sp. U87765 SZCCT0109]MBR1351344.1 sulfite dehydrogenase [Bradyrhizobium sp. U87765 SZCCT0048]
MSIRTRPGVDHPRADHSDDPAPSRRSVLRGAVAGGLAAGSLAATARAAEPAAQGAGNLPPHVPEWMKAPGAPTGEQPYGLPSPFEKDVVRNISKTLPQYISASSRTPLQDLDGIITPNGLFYERHHGGVPAIDPATHRLMLHGLVERPLTFTMEELRRFPSQSRIHFLECSGNPVYTKPYGKTASDLVGLVSCAEWTGVPLRLVLEEAGLKPEAKWIVAEGADAAALTRSVPIEKCLDDALLAYSQNGERLRPQQGYPLRLFLPGFEGNMSVKWLRRLKAVAEPAYSREETSKYTDLMPDGSAREFTFVMEAKSIITRPSGGQRLTSTGYHEITGLAWSGRGKVSRVEVSVDGGASWQDAELQAPVLTRALTRFRMPWRWEGQETTIQSRAIDETGYVQPTLADLVAVRGTNSFYHNNAIWPWRIAANGEISNALA